MQEDSSATQRSLFVRGNDLKARDLGSRVSRLLRAALRRWCSAGAMIADDPRVLQAWRRKWDGAHYIQLRRWHDRGFRPAIVYDIGAHEGLWSEMCQEIFAPARCVLFEPQRSFQQIAKARQPARGADWRVVGVALGESDESNTLHITQNAAASSLLTPIETVGAPTPDTHTVGQEKVEVASLDKLVSTQLLPIPGLVKIDVQGFEGRVLKGGENTLRQAERMVIEVSLRCLYEGQSLLPEVLAQVVRWGFELDDITETYRQWPQQLWQVDLWVIRRS